MRWTYVVVALLAVALAATALTLAPLRPGQTMRVVGTATINALAVSSGGGGAVVPIEVTLLYPGNGRAYVAGVPEAGEGFGPSAQVALYVAARLAGVSAANYTALLRVTGLEANVGGPSASGYITAALFALMKGLPLRNDTAMTGIILPDGTIGWVGGVGDKVAAAAQNGIKRVLVPLGEQGQAKGVRGVQVIPVATIQQAIYYLTGYNVTSPYGPSYLNTTVFNKVSRYLYEQVLAIYRNATGTSANAYVNMSAVSSLAARGQYYTAASLLFNGIYKYYLSQVSSGALSANALSSKALELTKNYEKLANNITITSNNLGIIIGIYERIYQIYQQANSSSPDVAFMYARAVTLPPWINAAEMLAYGRVINESSLSDMAETYLEYAYVMYSYVITTYGSQLPPDLATELQQSLQLAESLYSSKHYLASLAASLDTISLAENALASPGADSLAPVERQTAFENIYRAAACGSPNILPLSYIQFGDYYMNSDTTTALYMYEEASMYAAAIGDILCSSNATYIIVKAPSNISTLAPPPAITASAQTGFSAANYIISIILIVFVISVIIVSAKKR
ncbi:peptidase S16, lon domain protein [Thermoproteus uzoniensis 768-20]|uniref:Peptidase S16, lon domain protein n=1 Tax=Thermoproteus uzoniensis (strain 768-20) TaxID=999630 RepID=F2L294_THEU7|nr:S16 family serine protease [Thermoproteus uzoniensis]AEA13021.1 peptidase S16, lon domain protein [Thermoproteus uzoniensis 768-20]